MRRGSADRLSGALSRSQYLLHQAYVESVGYEVIPVGPESGRLKRASHRVPTSPHRSAQSSSNPRPAGPLQALTRRAWSSIVSAASGRQWWRRSWDRGDGPGPPRQPVSERPLAGGGHDRRDSIGATVVWPVWRRSGGRSRTGPQAAVVLDGTGSTGETVWETVRGPAGWRRRRPQSILQAQANDTLRDTATLAGG